MHPAERRAQALLDRLYIGLPAVDVAAVAQALDINVHHVVLEGFSVATVYRYGEKYALINTSQPDYRRRFALAHAIAHTQLHPNLNIACNLVAPEIAAPIRRVEREASRFAAALLMPEWAVHWFYAKGYPDEEMAQVFHVSPEAVFWRLHHLGLVRESVGVTAD